MVIKYYYDVIIIYLFLFVNISQSLHYDYHFINNYKHNGNINNSAMNKINNLTIYQMLTSLLMSLSTGEQIIQAIKEVLTTKQLFHPLSLFKYLTRGSWVLTRKHIQQFLQENDFSASEQQIKIIFQFEGITDRMNYSDFLQMVYPFSTGCIRQINNIHFKRYPQTQSLPVSEQVVYAFFVLLTEQITLINKIQVQKRDSSSQIPKDKLKKIIRSIKRLGDKKLAHCDSDQNAITSLQLIDFVGMFSQVKVQEHFFLYLMRKLKVDSKGSIKINNLQAVLRPWKKNKKCLNNSNLTHGQKVLNQKKQQNLIETEKLKKFNQNKYKQELYKQMSMTLRAGQKNQKAKASQIKIKQGQIYHKSPIKNKQNKSNTPKKYNKAKPRSNGVDVKLFLKYVQAFLKNVKQIQGLKVVLQNQHKVDFLKVFKQLDKKQRGVITAEDLLHFYQSLGGISISTNFELLISTVSLSSQKWLSFTQFCEIFKPSFQRIKQKNMTSLGGVHETKRLMSQIIYLSLKNEQQLLQIRRQFKKGEAEHLFFLINKQETGFINYQELKTFLLNVSMQISMQELMLILKRLDRGKNGVVTEVQFQDYFYIEM